MVTFLSATEIWIEEASPRSKPFGTLIYHIPEYALWDRHTNRACICDTGFTGHDCKLRQVLPPSPALHLLDHRFEPCMLHPKRIRALSLTPPPSAFFPHTRQIANRREQH